jgi:prepilin-type N-terminal cleavage/methylation domain-containing protein
MNNRRRAMTLLEVIVALTVAGAALAAGAAVLGFLTDQQGRTGAQGIASASAVRSAMRLWTSEARLSTEGDAEFRGVPEGRSAVTRLMPTHDEHDAELTFITVAPTGVSPSGTQVHFHIEKTADSAHARGLVAELTPWRRTGAPVIVSLAPNAVAFRARYLASLFGRPVWQDSWISTSVLPAAVEIRVVFDTISAAESNERAARALLSLPMTIALAARR